MPRVYKTLPPRTATFSSDGKTCSIPLTNGQFAIIDAEDHDRINQWQWLAAKDKNTYYAVRWITTPEKKRAKLSMHRLVFGECEHQVDHKDGNGLNNCKGNLRKADNRANQCNRGVQKHSKTGKKGVWRHQGGKFKSTITVNGKRMHLGTFSDEADAEAAYRQAAEKYHGDFSFTKSRS